MFRNVGRVQGIGVYLADLLTGAAVLLPTGWLPLPDVTRLVASIMLLVGTFFPLFGGFKGGTGLAKGTGAVMGINPVGFLVGTLLGILVVWRIRNPSLSGGVVIAIAGLFSIFLYNDAAAVGLVLVGALILLRSRLQYRSLKSANSSVQDIHPYARRSSYNNRYQQIPQDQWRQPAA